MSFGSLASAHTITYVFYVFDFNLIFNRMFAAMPVHRVGEIAINDRDTS